MSRTLGKYDGILEEYRGQAHRAKGKVYWFDESAVRSDDVRGRSYAPCGNTPEIPAGSEPASP